MIKSAPGSTIGPPADILYPVEPVGVATMIPSALSSHNSLPLTNTEKLIICRLPHLEIVISFNASDKTTSFSPVS